MKKYFFLFIALSIFSSCTQLNIEPQASEQCDEARGYCINFEKHMNGREWMDNWTDQGGEPTDHSISNGIPTSSDQFLYADITSYTSCPLTERHMPTVNQTHNGKWGKVVFVHTWDPLPGENDVFCRNLELPQKSSAYAFCAEKDGKAVAICIQQMTDDEEMARMIFESFRWID